MELRLMCVLCLALRLVRASNDDPPVVTTSQGRITGTTLQFRPAGHPELDRDVDAFLGIPYAEPPVGPLRFKSPVAKSWSGELKATELGNRCPQALFPIGNITISGPFDEDCLYLDVFVPRSPPANAAVLVWIHGGGYSMGAGVMTDEFYPTATSSIGDVIVVTMNYRLGALGFLSTADDVIPGNFGLLDQKLAMEWVRDNIQAFGGDPERVAIFGESAGSGAVSLHMISPGSSGLFRGAIMQSGAALSWSLMPPDIGRDLAYGMGKIAGCDSETSEELLECLQKVEGTDVFVNNQQGELLQDVGKGKMVFFGPTIDGSFLPSRPEDLLEKGAINDAVSIIGANADEGMLILMMLFPNNTDDDEPFLDSAEFDSYLPMCTNMLSPEPIVSKALKMVYTNASCTDGPACNHLDAMSQICGDIMFVCPGEKNARMSTKAGRRVYRYHMTHVPTTTLIGPKWTKCNHGDDLSFVFGLPFMESEYDFTEDEARMSIQTITYWANLAKTGNPNLSSLDAELTDEEKKTEWPLFTVEGLEYKELSPDMLNGRGLKTQECRYMNEFIPDLIKSLEEARKDEAADDGANKWTQDGDSSSETCTEDKCPGE